VIVEPPHRQALADPGSGGNFGDGNDDWSHDFAVFCAHDKVVRTSFFKT